MFNIIFYLYFINFAVKYFLWVKFDFIVLFLPFIVYA